MEETALNIIAYLIVLLALIIAVKKLFKKVSANNESPCTNGCGGCTAKCDLKELANSDSLN